MSHLFVLPSSLPDQQSVWTTILRDNNGYIKQSKKPLQILVLFHYAENQNIFIEYIYILISIKSTLDIWYNAHVGLFGSGHV